MEDLFGINAHRQSVQENIEKAFDLGFDADNNIEGIEKAKHQVGDIHPNGRWVWTEYAPGKFDWKSLRGKHHKGNTQQTTTKNEDSSEINNDIYNDAYKRAMAKEETVDHLKSSLEKLKGNLQLCEDAIKEVTFSQAKEKLQENAVTLKSKIKAVEDALSEKEKNKVNRTYDIPHKTTDDKEVASFMDKVKTFSSKYNDPSKISVSKTPKGNWNVHYDGHRLGIFDASTLSEETANKQGWNEDSGEKFKQRWKNEHKDLSDETIQSYADNSRDVKYKQDVVDAAKELLEERKNKKQEEKKESEKIDIQDYFGKRPTKGGKAGNELKLIYDTAIKAFNNSLKNKDFSESSAEKFLKDTFKSFYLDDKEIKGYVFYSLDKWKKAVEKYNDKNTTTKSTSSKGVDEYINKMADDSKWAALVEVMADIDLSDYETEEEAREAIRNKVSLKKLESAWKKFNKQ